MRANRVHRLQYAATKFLCLLDSLIQPTMYVEVEQQSFVGYVIGVWNTSTTVAVSVLKHCKFNIAKGLLFHFDT